MRGISHTGHITTTSTQLIIVQSSSRQINYWEKKNDTVAKLNLSSVFQRMLTLLEQKVGVFLYTWIKPKT